MKTSYIFIIVLFILLVAITVSTKHKEGFLNNYCAQNKDCTSCASASGCSWCPKSKVCLISTTLKSTDPNCNQNNTIASSFRCQWAEGVEMPTLPEAIASNDIMYDFSLYKNRITDKIPPPNLYMSGELKVSNEDLLSNMNDVRNDITNYKLEMPGIISSAVEGQIKPMVKGVLSDNYYIQGFQDFGTAKNAVNGAVKGSGLKLPNQRLKQMNQGFEDMNLSTKCQTFNSCSTCVGSNGCAWNPRSNQCETAGPNNKWQITQPSRCVLSVSTIGQMVKNPAGNV
jgi:hypothetical protein